MEQSSSQCLFVMAISPMHLQGEIVGPVVSVRDDDFTGDAVSVDVDPAPSVKAKAAAAASASPRLQVPTSVPTIVPGVSPPPGSAGRAHQVGCCWPWISNAIRIRIYSAVQINVLTRPLS